MSPGKYIQGAGELKNLGKYASQRGRAALVLISEGGRKRCGADIEKSFADAGVPATFATFCGECTHAEIDRLIAVAKERFVPERYPNVVFENMNLFDLKDEDEYDLVVCYSCLPHFFDHDRAIAVMARSMKEGGRLAVCNLKYHHVSGDRESDDHKKMMEHMPEHRFLTIPRLLQICLDHGLELTYSNNDENHTIIVVTKTGGGERV